MDVRNLSRRPKRKREPLAASPDPESIPAHRAVGERLADTSVETTTGTGTISGPFTEQSRVTSTVRICCDSDPSLFIDFEVSTQITFEDADGNSIVLDLTPDLTSNCP